MWLFNFYQNTMEDQIRLFEMVKSKISSKLAFVDEIEDLLNVSKECAYRRIRGETVLSFAEWKKISEKYHLSIDGIINYKSDNSAVFQYSPVDISNIDSYVACLKRLLNFMEEVSVSSNKKELIFSALDIPVYHICKYPDLAFFKLYIWNDTLNSNSVSFEKFYDGLQKDKILSVYDQIHQAYMNIPSIEVCTEQTIDVFLREFVFYFETGRFESKDTALFLLDKFLSLIEMLKNYADVGYKDKEREIPFLLYSCSVDLENSFLLLKNGDQKYCVLDLYAISRIFTDNDLLCAETGKWMDSLISKSMLISGSGAFKERLRFFQTIKKKIVAIIEKVSLS